MLLLSKSPTHLHKANDYTSKGMLIILRTLPGKQIRAGQQKVMRSNSIVQFGNKGQS